MWQPSAADLAAAKAGETHAMLDEVVLGLAARAALTIGVLCELGIEDGRSEPAVDDAGLDPRDDRVDVEAHHRGAAADALGAGLEVACFAVGSRTRLTRRRPDDRRDAAMRLFILLAAVFAVLAFPMSASAMGGTTKQNLTVSPADFTTTTTVSGSEAYTVTNTSGPKAAPNVVVATFTQHWGVFAVTTDTCTGTVLPKGGTCTVRLDYIAGLVPGTPSDNFAFAVYDLTRPLPNPAVGELHVTVV